MNVNRNYTPLAVLSFFISLLFLVLGLLLCFDVVEATSGGAIESPLLNKIIAVSIVFGVSLFFFIFGISYIKLTKRYFKEKREFENEPIDETVKDEIEKRTCPNCGKTHDIDYPKCPNCKFNYFE